MTDIPEEEKMRILAEAVKEIEQELKETDIVDLIAKYAKPEDIETLTRMFSPQTDK